MGEAQLPVAVGIVSSDPVLKHLNAFTLGRLSCCCKHLNSSVTSFLQHSLHVPLIPAVLAVAVSEQEERQEGYEYEDHGMVLWMRKPPLKQSTVRCLSAVTWLCSKAGSAAVAKQPGSALLCLPNVSWDLALKLIRAGLRVSYADVLAAAKQGVGGLDSWVCCSRRGSRARQRQWHARAFGCHELPGELAKR
jgi:hypothetical protein